MFPVSIRMENIRFLCSHGNLYTKSMRLRNWGVLCMTMLFEKSRKEGEIVFFRKLKRESDLLVLRLEFPKFLSCAFAVAVTVGRLCLKSKLDRDSLNLMRGFTRWRRTGHGGGCV